MLGGQIDHLFVSTEAVERTTLERTSPFFSDHDTLCCTVGQTVVQVTTSHFDKKLYISNQEKNGDSDDDDAGEEGINMEESHVEQTAQQVSSVIYSHHEWKQFLFQAEQQDNVVTPTPPPAEVLQAEVNPGQEVSALRAIGRGEKKVSSILRLTPVEVISFALGSVG